MITLICILTIWNGSTKAVYEAEGTAQSIEDPYSVVDFTAFLVHNKIHTDKKVIKVLSNNCLIKK